MPASFAPADFGDDFQGMLDFLGELNYNTIPDYDDLKPGLAIYTSSQQSYGDQYGTGVIVLLVERYQDIRVVIQWNPEYPDGRPEVPRYSIYPVSRVRLAEPLPEPEEPSEPVEVMP